MKILFLTHYFPPESNAPASRVHEMCKRWMRDGHEVTVITGVPNAPEGLLYSGYRNCWRQREVIDGINVVRVWTHIAANKGTIRRILNYVTFMFSAVLAAMRQPRPDLLIATSPQFFCGIAGMIATSLRRVPFVLEIRDIWPESIATVGAIRTRILLKPLEWLERLMYRSADRIVTVGEGYREQLLERQVPGEKISVVTNGVDPELFKPVDGADEVRARHNLGDRFVCAYVGTIGMASGLDVVLRAARILRDAGRHDIAFLLVGDGAVREDLDRQAKADGLDNVIFTGRQPKADMPRYLAAVDACLVHLRRQDLFKYVLPSKIFEAAGMAKPIILGVEGHAAKLVRDAGAGVTIEPENEHELIAAVEQLAKDRNAAAAIGAAGQHYVLQHFNRDRLSRDYLDVLRQVADPARTRAGVERMEAMKKPA